MTSKSNLFTLSAPVGDFCGFSADECAVLRDWLDDGGFSADYLAGGGFLLETDTACGEWFYNYGTDEYVSREWIESDWENNKDFLREEYECDTIDEFIDVLTDMGGDLRLPSEYVYAFNLAGHGFSPDAWREDLEWVLDDVADYLNDCTHTARRVAVEIWKIKLGG